MKYLVDLSTAGVGAIISIAHHGDDGKFPSMCTPSINFHSMAVPLVFDPAAPAWLRQQAAVNQRGGPLYDVSQGSALIRRLLTAGKFVTIAFDVPGTTPMTVYRRNVLGASGAIRIAFEMGSPVVMVTSHPSQRYPNRAATLRISPPLHPREYASVDALIEEINRHHERAVTDWPEAADRPRARWNHPARETTGSTKPSQDGS